jgi:hypothetical protein
MIRSVLGKLLKVKHADGMKLSDDHDGVRQGLGLPRQCGTDANLDDLVAHKNP